MYLFVIIFFPLSSAAMCTFIISSIILVDFLRSEHKAQKQNTASPLLPRLDFHSSNEIKHSHVLMTRVHGLLGPPDNVNTPSIISGDIPNMQVLTHTMGHHVSPTLGSPPLPRLSNDAATAERDNCRDEA